MALLAPKKIDDKAKIKLEIERDLLEKIKAYCKWVGITEIDSFFSQASQFILNTDKDWKIHLKTFKTNEVVE